MSKRSKKNKKKRWTGGSPGWMVAGSIGKGNRDDYQNWRNRGFLSGSSNSAVKRIDPATGEVISSNVIEEAANDILRADDRIAGGIRKKTKRRRPHTGKGHTPSEQEKTAFYQSWDWRKMRVLILKVQGRRCQCCGAEPTDKDMAGKKVKITVDHIKPLSKYWHLRLERSNLQVLCDECNQGKSNWDETDYRQSPAPDEWIVKGSGVSKDILEQLSVHGETIQ